MSKIICDVCGTRYPESADQCPICGCVRVGGAKTVADDILMDEELPVSRSSSVRGGRFSKSNVRKRNREMDDYDELEEEEAPRPKAAPVPVPAPQEVEEEDVNYNERPRKEKSNTVLNKTLSSAANTIGREVGKKIVRGLFDTFFKK